MSSDVVKASVLSDALLLKPTFFSVFIGNNDALAYALSGGTSDDISPLEGSPGIGFESSVNALIDALITMGGKGVVANLPDLMNVPYFTTIPYNGLRLTPSEATLLNKTYEMAGIRFKKGKNEFVVADAAEPAGIRKMLKGELVLMDIFLDPLRENYLKGKIPIPKKYYLTQTEIAKVQTAINDYNVVLRNASENKGLAFVDTNELLKTVVKDRTYCPETLNITYTKRGVFSLDGLHPNPFGQALLANEFISAVNHKYGTRIPLLKTTRYKRLSLTRI